MMMFLLKNFKNKIFMNSQKQRKHYGKIKTNNYSTNENKNNKIALELVPLVEKNFEIRRIS